LTGATERATADAQLTPSGLLDKFRDYAALPKGHVELTLEGYRIYMLLSMAALAGLVCTSLDSRFRRQNALSTRSAGRQTATN